MHALRLLVRVATGIALLTTALLGPTARPAAADDRNQRGQMALYFLNRARVEAGADSLAYDARLETAALAHARYIQLNHEYGHVEVSGRTGFSGISFSDRQIAAGYDRSPAGEVVAGVIAEESEPAARIEGWLSGPYHRAVLLDPRFRAVGYAGPAGGAAVAEFGDPSGPAKFVRYPGPGSTNVPRFFYGGETPNPLPPGAATPAGYPVTLIIGATQRWRVVNASISGPSGALAAYAVIDDNSYSLIPVAPLAEQTNYSVTMSGLADDASFNQTWTFTTAAALGKVALNAFALAGGGVYLGWSPTGANPPMSYGIARCHLCDGTDHVWHYVSASVTSWFDSPPLGAPMTYYVLPMGRGDEDGPPAFASLTATSNGDASKFHSQWYSQSAYPDKLHPGEVTTVWISFVNIGTAPWVRGVWGQQANLGLNLDDLTPYQLHMDANWLWNNRVATTDAQVVRPGEIGEFRFQVRAPMQPGAYSLHVRPVVDGSAWMEDNGVFLNFTVR